MPMTHVVKSAYTDIVEGGWRRPMTHVVKSAYTDIGISYILTCHVPI